MNKQSRLENSAKNSILGMSSQAVNILLGLVVRTVFIRTLSSEYLGINGLFTNILTMLSLAEMGIGGAIVYSMYKPIAQNDQIMVAKLMNLYQKAYRIIGLIVACIGLCVTPFLDAIVKNETSIENLKGIYLLFLANTVLSYFFAYKQSLFSADQRQRVLHIFTLLFYIIRSALQLLVLLIWKNYYLYLISQILCTVLCNVSVSHYANKEYPFLKQYKHEKLTKEEKKPIFDNVKSLFVYKIGSTVLDGTDNIIISAMNGVVSVGLLSNYTLVTGSISGFLSQFSSSISGSIGNFIASENSERHEQLLKIITFFYFIVYGFFFVVLTVSLSPFITVWAGRGFVLNQWVVFVHCLNLYIWGMMNAVWTFRSTLGLFRQGKWRPLFSAVINVVVSIWWAKKTGLIGVLLGTTFTRVVTNVWFDPFIVYKYGLKKTPYRYYAKWLCYLIVCLIDIAIVLTLMRLLVLPDYAAFFFAVIIAGIVFSSSVLLLFHKSNEFLYLKHVARQYVQKRVRKKVHISL